MKICPFCNKETKPSAHIYSCAKKNGFELTNEEIKFEFIKFNFEGLVENFVENYNNLFSIPDFTNKYNTDNKTILFLIDYFNLKKRSLKESSNLISTKKYKETCIKKYGCDNVSKSEIIKDKKRKTFITNYGVDNIFKEQKFKEWIKENNFAWMYEESNKKRSKKQSESINYFWDNITDERKYEIIKIKTEASRKYWDDLSDEDRISRIQKYSTYSSKLESRISEILINNNISYTSQFFINKNSYDFRFSNTKIILEIQGDFWHGNPNKYKDGTLLNMPGKGKISVNDLWKKDEEKRKNALKQGYIVEYLWESDMVKMSDDDIYNNIINFLKNQSKKL